MCYFLCTPVNSLKLNWSSSANLSIGLRQNDLSPNHVLRALTRWLPVSSSPIKSVTVSGTPKVNWHMQFLWLYCYRMLTRLTLNGMEVPEASIEEIKKILPDCVIERWTLQYALPSLPARNLCMTESDMVSHHVNLWTFCSKQSVFISVENTIDY